MEKPYLRSLIIKMYGQDWAPTDGAAAILWTRDHLWSTYVEPLLKENEKRDHKRTIDPSGYVTAAATILDALKLVVGKDVTEHALPVITQIIKDNIEPNFHYYQLEHKNWRLSNEIIELKKEIESLKSRLNSNQAASFPNLRPHDK